MATPIKAARGTRARVKFFNDGRPLADAPAALTPPLLVLADETVVAFDDIFGILFLFVNHNI